VKSRPGRRLTGTMLAWAWGLMTWPARTGRDFTELVAGPLYSAPTYQVDDDIVGAVTGMYEQTGRQATEIRAADMISPSGFAWLDTPVPLTDYGGAVITNRAVSWNRQRMDLGATVEAGVRVTSWCEAGQQTAFAPEGHYSPSGLALAHSAFVPFGERYGRSGESAPDDVVRWLHCLWLFLQTTIVATTCKPASRAARRRAARVRQLSDVTVVHLRYTVTENDAGQDGVPRLADWSCRWVVRGHHRHLGDYREAGCRQHEAMPEGPHAPCQVCGLPTTPVGAYIKGPPGKPLRVNRKLYKVDR
jgi:hypothetical protein